jgi:hypothetical protein
MLRIQPVVAVMEVGVPSRDIDLLVDGGRVATHAQQPEHKHHDERRCRDAYRQRGDAVPALATSG